MNIELEDVEHRQLLQIYERRTTVAIHSGCPASLSAAEGRGIFRISSPQALSSIGTVCSGAHRPDSPNLYFILGYPASVY